MEKTYREIMDHVTVTEDMRRRILHRLSKPVPAARKVLSIRFWAAAACLTLLVSVAALPTLFPAAEENDPPVTGYPLPNRQEVSSVQALAEAVGFPVEELHQLPFSVEDTQYTVLGNQLAEIRYDGGTESAVFRKAAGADDPSGDYTAYSDIQEATLAGYEITLKGAEGQFTLGIWQKDGYSYSLLLSDPLPAEGWEAILQNIY